MTRCVSSQFPATLLCLLLVAPACVEHGGAQPVRSAAKEASSPRLVGLTTFVGDMLPRGAGERSAEQIAETIDFVGGDISVLTGNDYTHVEITVLRDHFDLAMELVADLAQRPTFPDDEIERFRARELSRLAFMHGRSRWLADRAFHAMVYGADHPYGHYDAEPEGIRALTREHLQAFHREHYVPRNSFLVVVGDVDTATVSAAAGQRFGGWEDRPAPTASIPPAPERDRREVLVVHMPGQTQARITMGNVALRRADPDYFRFRVANQVLGGGASSRLFMNLRERCGYTYGVYSRVRSSLAPAPIAMGGAVDNEHVAGAFRELFALVDGVRTTPAPAEELRASQVYISGHFPMQTETAGNLAALVTTQQLYGLADDYWDTYRSNIDGVTAEQARDAARRYLDPDHMAIVMVGDAEQIAEPARRYGPVRVVSLEGNLIEELPAAPGEWPGGEPGPCPVHDAPDEQSRAEQPPAPGAARDMDFPDVHESTLDNGFQVFTIERNQLPLVVVRFVVRAGSAADPL